MHDHCRKKIEEEGKHREENEKQLSFHHPSDNSC